jgi:hypothetical protein
VILYPRVLLRILFPLKHFRASASGTAEDERLFVQDAFPSCTYLT